ncbi:MAG: hypothetical protein B5766_01020 [Candidatus Lumbricidophila eiseniae]|uniref:ABC transporter permease n=1 Tax=Candidatus Lumbricidiphila eiseniae TaxID=1969409 RepID=A0A2A6FVC2_9MICO|nr:MAG: hypothetical protein B5766_01020 [Candidatus Lumbricidophila eiseniae]
MTTHATIRTSAHASDGLGRAVSGAFSLMAWRPGYKVATVVWSLQILIFAYAINYAVVATLPTEQIPPGLLASLLPEATGSYVLASIPVYGAPVFIVVGAMMTASEYRWGVLQTLLARFSNRTSFLLGRWIVLVSLAAIIAVLSIVLSVVASVVVALMLGEPVAFPSFAEYIVEFLAGTLMVVALATFGFFLGVLTRNVMVAAAIGIAWTIGVETLLVGSLAGILSFFEALRSGLLTINAGSLSTAIAESTGLDVSSTFGATTAVSGGVAAGVLGVWTIVTLIGSIVLFRRRDVS